MATNRITGAYVPDECTCGAGDYQSCICVAPPATDTPVGLAEIAGRLGVKRQTADNWQQRGVLPAPRWTVGGRPAWSWQRDIEPWAQETGRLSRDLQER